MNKQTEALKIGDRVVIKDTAGFSKRLHGIITDFKQDKFWVLRDGADKPVWFHPDELQLEEALEQPAQEPVAWMLEYRDDEFDYWHKHCDEDKLALEMWFDAIRYDTTEHKIYPLYTHPAPSQWISVKDRLPEVKSGNAKEFIVVIYSGYTGRSFVTSRHFLNKMELYNEYSENDFDEVSGWHERTYHLEYDDYYTLVDSCNADAVRYEVTHWMPLPDAPKEQV